MVFAYFVLRTPPLSVGAGLGHRATHLWIRTRFQSYGLGLGGSWRLLSFFYSSWVISLRFPRNSLAFPPVACGMATACVEYLFLPHKARSSFHFFKYLAGFVALPLRGVGVVLEEPHLRLMF